MKNQTSVEWGQEQEGTPAQKKKSGRSWRRKRKPKGKNASQDQPANQKEYKPLVDRCREDRLLQSLLNKVTPSNFDKVLMVFVSETRIHHDEKRSRDAIETIITRAAMDSRYASVYAELCEKLVQELDRPGDRDSTLEASNRPSKLITDRVSFKDLLCRICRENVNQNTDPASNNGSPKLT